jgi:hypothetical protein
MTPRYAVANPPRRAPASSLEEFRENGDYASLEARAFWRYMTQQVPEGVNPVELLDADEEETLDGKARRYLTEARVRILHCDEQDGILEAEVRGDSRLHSAGRDEEGWFCSCPARTPNCSHVRALRLITVLEPREARA